MYLYWIYIFIIAYQGQGITEQRNVMSSYNNIRLDDESHYFTYFSVLSLISIAAYIGYYNKQKVRNNFMIYLYYILYYIYLFYIIFYFIHFCYWYLGILISQILAIVLEGRRSRNRGRRRSSAVNYTKLDCTLEEAVTSQCNANVTHVIY